MMFNPDLAASQPLGAYPQTPCMFPTLFLF